MLLYCTARDNDNVFIASFNSTRAQSLVGWLEHASQLFLTVVCVLD